MHSTQYESVPTVDSEQPDSSISKTEKRSRHRRLLLIFTFIIVAFVFFKVGQFSVSGDTSSAQDPQGSQTEGVIEENANLEGFSGNKTGSGSSDPDMSSKLSVG